MAKLAILGFGTVGSGVYEVLQQNAKVIARRTGQPLTVGYICDIRDFSAHPDAELFVQDIEPILADKEVKVVAETIGGATIAYEYVLRALSAGRHVVTSNKELVAAYGAELLAKAKEKGVCFLFEASVGGGTPVITPMHQCLAANNVVSVAGIVNGTTNFMLSQMKDGGMSFDAALQKAQQLGYAETIDPSYDVDGLDAGRKIAILASLAFGSHVYPQNIYTRGIRGITPADMQNAAQLGCAVKLLAYARRTQDGALVIGVEPMLVPRQSQLAGVEDVFNAVQMEGDMLGEVLFYGQGAGKLATASAVVADAMDALRQGAGIHRSLFWQPASAVDGLYAAYGPCEVYVRTESRQGAAALAQAAQGRTLQDETAVLLPAMGDAQLEETLQRLDGQGQKAALCLKRWG